MALYKEVNELRWWIIPLLAVMQGGECARFQFVHTFIERRYTQHLNHYPLPSAAFTRSGVNGIWRMRAPVASNIALPMAAAVTVTAVSPAPAA